jgi:hypothetical protein
VQQQKGGNTVTALVLGNEDNLSRGLVEMSRKEISRQFLDSPGCTVTTQLYKVHDNVCTSRLERTLVVL